MEPIRFDFFDKAEFTAFLDSLPIKDAAKLLAVLDEVKARGLLSAEKRQLVKKLETNLYEIRSKFSNNIQRAIYFRVEGSHYVITHGFTKKQQKRKLSAQNKFAQYIREGEIAMDDVEKYLRTRSQKDPEFDSEYTQAKLNQQLGYAVWQLRTNMQLSVKDFATVIGQSEQDVTAMEDGSKELTVKELSDIAEKTDKKINFQFS